MTASRIPMHDPASAPNTACPQRRSFVAGDARRRGQACHNSNPPDMTAFGAALTTPAMLAGVDNARYSVIVDG
jgi:hypothetical protein